jgi:uncharacterized phage protein gp47/JayE
MPLAIDDLITPPTVDQVFNTFVASLESLGVPASGWRKGGVPSTILRVVAVMYQAFAVLIALFVRSGFLETAVGPWLTTLADQVFNVQREDATFATGQVQVTNGGGGVFSFTADQVRFLWPQGVGQNKAYTNVSAFTLNPGDVKLIDVRAVEIGSGSTAPPGSIVAFETTLLGVTCTNLTAVVGNDAEADDDLRTRCRNKLAAISVRGPRGAYAYAVDSALRLDGTPVDINRSSISPDSSTGTVTVYCASPSGTPLSSDLDQVRANIEDVARPDSVTVDVLAVTSVPVTRTLTVWAKRTDGVSASDISTLADAALTSAISTYPIGGIPKPPDTQGYLYASFIEGAAEGAHPSIYDVDGAGSDVALSPGQVATLASTITVNIVDVP